MVKSEYFIGQNSACCMCHLMSSLGFTQGSLKLYFCRCSGCNNVNSGTLEGLRIYLYSKVKVLLRVHVTQNISKLAMLHGDIAVVCVTVYEIGR